MQLVLLLSKVIHVVGAVIWAGWAFSNIAFLAPAVQESGQAGGTVMANLLKTSLLRVMRIVPLLVVLTGGLLYWFYSANLNLVVLSSFRGIALTIGALAGIAAFFEGMLVTGPTAERMRDIGSEIAQGGGPPNQEQLAEMARLRERLSKAGMRGGVFLLVAVFGMSLGG